MYHLTKNETVYNLPETYDHEKQVLAALTNIDRRGWMVFVTEQMIEIFNSEEIDHLIIRYEYDTAG